MGLGKGDAYRLSRLNHLRLGRGLMLMLFARGLLVLMAFSLEFLLLWWLLKEIPRDPLSPLVLTPFSRLDEVVWVYC